MISQVFRKLIPEQFRPIGYLVHLTRQKTGCKVAGGPFNGMRYIQHSAGSAYIPKLLGMYECELNTCVEAICARKPALIVDIGAAEGYFAVGLALRNPQARVIGYEMEDLSREYLNEMVILNEVASRISIRGKCEPADLEAALADDAAPVVVCDVEGYEQQLLDPAAVPALEKAAILVELHDFIVPRITETLQERFSQTHHIIHIWQEPRHRDEFPWKTLGTRLLPTSYLDWAVSEWRPLRMAWLWMEPKSGAVLKAVRQ
jgi:hypothetical protein